MKRLTLFLLLAFGWLHAAELPNTGLAQNEYGYYGEGVTFGGYPIVGEWYLQGHYSFLPDGTALSDGHQNAVNYGVSADGLRLRLKDPNAHASEAYEIRQEGTSGCFLSDYDFSPDDIMGWTYPFNICKTTHNNKSYGPNSNTVTITVGVD
ncbi:MAG: hypothetical protein JXK05_02040 [Campylobacterales bacterium]|nr:hypothetical protein [Campylobacterales bacterium]